MSGRRRQVILLLTEAKLINTDRILNHHFLLRLSGIVLERRFPVLRRIDHQ